MGWETIIPAALGLFGATQGGGDTTVTNTDPATQARYNDLYNKAQGIAQQPFIPYTGARVAGFNPDQLQGFDATRNMFNQSMSFNPRNQLNNLANMSAPGVNLPFGYNQPPRTPIFQPMPITGGGGGRPPQPPSIGGIGGGRPVMPGAIQLDHVKPFMEPPRLVGGIVEPTREVGGIDTGMPDPNTRIGNYYLDRQNRGIIARQAPPPGSVQEGPFEGGPATGPTYSSDPFLKGSEL